MMDLTTALAFVTSRHQGVLTTIRTNGRPQLSNIFYVAGVAGDDGALTVSITDTRAKTANIRRDPRVSLYVLGTTSSSTWCSKVRPSCHPWPGIRTTPRLNSWLIITRPVLANMRIGTSTVQPWWLSSRLILTIRPEYAYGMIAN